MAKTNFIVFGHKTGCGNIHIYIDGAELDQVDCAKFLGIQIDAHSTWKNHIAFISSKVSRGIGAINRVKFILAHKSLRMLYFTLIHPHLTYCCLVWGCASKTNLVHLKSLQKKAIRLITKSDYLAASKPIFIKLQLLTLDDICISQSLQFLASFKLNLLPLACHNLLDIADANKRHNTRSDNYFTCSMLRTNTSKQCLRYRGPKLWELLPRDIRNLTNIHAFKRDVKKFLIGKYQA